jgi:hypothetical protein
MWFKNRSRSPERMFPYWTPRNCNDFLYRVKEKAPKVSIADMGSELLQKAVDLKAKGCPEADQMFNISRLISEAAYATAGPSVLDGVRDSNEVDIAVIMGIYQIPKCSLLMADEILLSGSDSDSIAAALGRILIAKEQTAIFTAAIKTNRVESLWVDLLARDTMDSIRLKIAASSCLVKIKNDFNHLFNDDYRKKVALPLSLMVTHLLICEEKPNPTELFEVCYSGIPWCIGTVLAGKIDEVIDACSNLNSQINI